jgi:phosphoribosyl-ATP pyrophosphohydrolase
LGARPLEENVPSNAEAVGPEVLARLYEVIESRRGAHPTESRTARLFAAGLPKIAQKVGEEATEAVVAALAESDERLVSEAADLLYHLLVLLAVKRVHPGAVYAELAARAKE